MNYVFLVLKNRFLVKKCHIWSISVQSGEISAEKNFFLRYFYNTKRFVFEFQGESIEPFLSYRAHFRRYQHYRGFWQSAGTVTVE